MVLEHKLLLAPPNCIHSLQDHCSNVMLCSVLSSFPLLTVYLYLPA